MLKRKVHASERGSSARRARKVPPRHWPSLPPRGAALSPPRNLLRNLLRAAVAVASKRECCEENVWHHFQVPVVAAVNDIFRSCFCFFDRSSLEMLEVEAGCPGFQEALQVNQLAQP